MAVLRWSAAALLLTLLALSLAAAAVYFQQIGRAYERISGQSQVFATPDGAIEFRQGGSGPTVLVVHGSGGGYDQGELIAQAVLGEDFHWIAPSRFGYLRSTVPPGAGFDEQARAYARLLDHLGIDKVAVVAMSHGGPSSLLFAALYPERVSALVLLSCGVASSSDAQQAEANRMGETLTTIFSHDPLYWGVSTFFRKPLMKLMGANEEVIAGLSPEQRQVVDRVIDEMNPVAPRAAGVAFDNRAALPNERIAAIRAPTLILHAADDTLQLYRNAEFAAANIPGAKLVRFDKGGHLLIAVEQAAVQAQTRQFIVAHSAP